MADKTKNTPEETGTKAPTPPPVIAPLMSGTVVGSGNGETIIASSEAQLETFVEEANAVAEESLPQTPGAIVLASSAGKKAVLKNVYVENTDTSLVNVKVLKGGQFLEEGKTYPVSKETASQFVKDGIAEYVK